MIEQYRWMLLDDFVISFNEERTYLSPSELICVTEIMSTLRDTFLLNCTVSIIIFSGGQIFHCVFKIERCNFVFPKLFTNMPIFLFNLKYILHYLNYTSSISRKKTSGYW